MNKELRKLIIDVCNLYPKNVFTPCELAQDVIREMERKCREKFSFAVTYDNLRTIISEIEGMIKDERLAMKQDSVDNASLQTPDNLLTHHL